MLQAVRVRPVLRREQELAVEMVGCRPVPFVGVAAHVAAQRWMTVRFSGRTYPQLARIVRELCAVAGHWCLPLVAAVAVTVAVSPGQDAFARLPPEFAW